MIFAAVRIAPLLKHRCFPPSAARSFHAAKVLSLSDPYKTLGVARDASSKDIKRKYYELAKKYHPDVNKEEGADKKFQEIRDSYDVLSDETKRAQYDQFGAAAFNGGAGGPGGPGGASGGPFNPFEQGGFGFGFGGGSGGINLDDLFQAFGAGAGGRRGPQGAGQPQQVYKGDDIELAVRISLREACEGVHRTVKYSSMAECDTCHGSGLKKGEKTATCRTCHGTGQTVHMMQGGFQLASQCASCGGSGVFIPRSSACSSCGGEGVVDTQSSYDVDLPPGASDGLRLRAVEAGDAPHVRKSAGVRTRRGDLYIRVVVDPHPKFRRQGSDLLTTVEVPVTTASLGGTVQVETITGEKLKIKLASGTQPGTEISMDNKGMPRLNNRGVPGQRGALKVEVKVKIPRPTDEMQTMLLEAFADAIKDTDAKRQYEPVHEVKDDQNASEPGLLKRLFNKMTKRKD